MGPKGVPDTKIRWMKNVLKDIQATEIVNWIEINGSQLLSRPKLIQRCSD
jgi:hypothetical protein